MKPPPPRVRTANAVEISVTGGPCTGISDTILRSGASSGQYIVGRETIGNVLCIPDPEVSSRHLEFYERRGRWVVCDLGSLNGTIVDGVELKKPRGRNARGVAVELSSKSVIQLGGSTTIEACLASQDTCIEVERPVIASVDPTVTIDVADVDIVEQSDENKQKRAENDTNITLEQYLRNEVAKIAERCDKRTHDTLSTMKEDMISFRQIVTESL